MLSGALERRLRRAESILIGLTIAAVAYADWLTGPQQSMGFLYLVPLSYSALTHRSRVTIALVAVCVGLRQWISPLGDSPNAYFVRDWVLTGIFFAVVLVLARVGRLRTRFFEAARAQRDELMREVELAAEVQENLLRKNQPPVTAYDIVADLEPAKVVGGDYYDFIGLPEGRLGIVVADVAGKGLAAAMLMPAVSTTLNAVAERNRPPASALTELNRALYEKTGQSNYATVFYGVLDLDTGGLHYANGGHLPGLLVRGGGGAVDALPAGGTPVGLLPQFVIEEARGELAPGDALLLYTDGITEAEDEGGEQFGEAQLKAVARANVGREAAEIAAAVRGAVAEFGGSGIATDDATILVIKRPAEA